MEYATLINSRFIELAGKIKFELELKKKAIKIADENKLKKSSYF